jgi:hypothetical protein
MNTNKMIRENKRLKLFTAFCNSKPIDFKCIRFNINNNTFSCTSWQFGLRNHIDARFYAQDRTYAKKVNHLWIKFYMENKKAFKL